MFSLPDTPYHLTAKLKDNPVVLVLMGRASSRLI